MLPPDIRREPEIDARTTLFFLFVVAGAILAGMIFLGIFSLPGNQARTAEGPVNLTIGGSTTIQPVSELLARAYMDDHPEVKITVVDGGSGAGVAKTVTGEFDIGSVSRPLETGEQQKYPDLVVHQIGGSAIVVITGRDFPADQVTFGELQKLYDGKNDDVRNLPDISAVRTVVQRKDASGTEEVFAGWLFGSGVKNLDASLNARDRSGPDSIVQLAADGNTGVLQAVRENPGAIGFVDFGYAEGDPGVKIQKIVDNGTTTALPRSLPDIRNAILHELASQDHSNPEYVMKLTRPLNYITLGAPDAEEAGFIAYATSPLTKKYFNEVGYFSMDDIRGAR